MNNPRDYLPAKYKKTSSALGDLKVSDTKTNDELNNSPWSDLAKEPKVPSYRSNAVESDQSNSNLSILDTQNETVKSNSPVDSNIASDDSPAEIIPPTSFPKAKSKANNKKLAGLLVLFFLVVGVFSSYLLTQQSQDNRQQAARQYIIAPPGGCGAYPNTNTVKLDGVDYCLPADTTTPPNMTEGKFGYCWNCVPPRPATEDDWKNPALHIAGTYTWRYGCSGSSNECSCSAGESDCYRYIVNIPSTLEAAVSYATQYPHINQVLYRGDGSKNNLEIAPFYSCFTGSSSEEDPTITYNTVNCAAENIQDVCSFVDTSYNPPRCYLTNGAYLIEIGKGNTWSPYNTGCGDGVHDYSGENGYAGDCNTWHFTTCLNQGTGVNGLGCDIIDTPNITTEEPPDEPPTEPPTQPPTEPPTGTPTLPPELLCTDLEMLNSLGEEMQGNEDQDLINGDQVRFRGNSSDNSNPEVTFEFRILPPNTYAWQDLTNTDTGATAKNISAPYTVISSGHHIVQSRVCLSGVCQTWESNDEIDDEFTSIFEDVPVTYWAYRSILAIYNEEITSGCNSDPLRYCPEQATSRGQAATLIMKAKYGADYNFTEATTPVFADVGADNTMRKFIEKMYADGITAGCSSSPLNFCPDREITRAEMAVMLERAFLR